MDSELDLRLVTAERRAIERALQWHKHNLQEAADALGICKGTLYAKLKRHGLRQVRPRLPARELRPTGSPRWAPDRDMDLWRGARSALRREYYAFLQGIDAPPGDEPGIESKVRALLDRYDRNGCGEPLAVAKMRQQLGLVQQFSGGMQ
jgi:hypothetical protein